MAILDENGLLYEINDTGQRVLVRSINSEVRTYLRFTNQTNRLIRIYWRDFDGAQRFYALIEPDSYYDVNSYITHPWEFLDASTKEHYYVNNKLIFRAPENTGGMMYRTNWNVHIGLRSLRYIAMLAIGTQIRRASHVYTLNLPKGLESELKELIEKLLREDIGVREPPI